MCWSIFVCRLLHSFIILNWFRKKIWFKGGRGYIYIMYTSGTFCTCMCTIHDDHRAVRRFFQKMFFSFLPNVVYACLFFFFVKSEQASTTLCSCGKGPTTTTTTNKARQTRRAAVVLRFQSHVQSKPTARQTNNKRRAKQSNAHAPPTLTFSRPNNRIHGSSRRWYTLLPTCARKVFLSTK